jgi:hypothetical protein
VRQVSFKETVTRSKEQQRNDEAGQPRSRVNLYVLCALHTNAALTRNSAVDSEPCQVPFSCFVASVAIIIGAVRMFQVEALFLS